MLVENVKQEKKDTKIASSIVSNNLARVHNRARNSPRNTKNPPLKIQAKLSSFCTRSMRLLLWTVLLAFASLAVATATANNNVTLFSPLGQKFWYFDLQPVNSLGAFLVVGSPSTGGNQVTVALVNQHNMTVDN